MSQNADLSKIRLDIVRSFSSGGAFKYLLTISKLLACLLWYNDSREFELLIMGLETCC